MKKRMLGMNPLTRTYEYHYYDHATKQTVIETVQDVQPIIERNKKLANDGSYAARGKKADHFHIATIPNNVIVDLKDNHGIDIWNKDDLKKLEKLLMSCEFRDLRTCAKI